MHFMVEMPVWMGTKEAAEYIGVQPRTLYKRIDIGEVPAYRVGRVLRLRLSDLDEFLENARVKPGELGHLYHDGAEREDPPDLDG